MRLLLFFLTQAQSGAPGYLSRKGEDAAANLSETLARFLVEQLQLDLESGYETRAASLAKDPQWKELGRPGATQAAIAASAGLFKDVLLISGTSAACMKTMEPVSSSLALPVIVHPGLDGAAQTNPQNTRTLQSTLPELIKILASTGAQTRVLLVGTTREALLEWLTPHLQAEQMAETNVTFAELAGEDDLPFVYSAALDGEPENPQAWLFD